MGLLKCGEVTAFGELVEMDEFGIGLLGPTEWGRIEFVGKNAHGNRDVDAFGIEVADFAPVLPLESGAGKRRVRQPGDRDVVEDVVARETLGFSLKHACDQLIAACVVIKEISREADG